MLSQISSRARHPTRPVNARCFPRLQTKVGRNAEVRAEIGTLFEILNHLDVSAIFVDLRHEHLHPIGAG